MKKCANRKCGDWISDKFTSVRHAVSWPVGPLASGQAFLAGAVAAIIKLVS
jgi:hypothetical protein